MEQVHSGASPTASAPAGILFVGREMPEVSRPPVYQVAPFGTGFDTHTHTAPLCGARVRNLNRYLKSLRNKRKKDRKSSTKRARENDRCRKMKNEYLALDWGRETSLKNHLKSLKESPTNDEKRKKESGGQGGGVRPCVCTCVCLNT